jgi:hypothetical protein
MWFRFALAVALVLVPNICSAQGGPPVTVTGSSWRAEKLAAPTQQSGSVSPQKEITPNDKYWARKARENQPQGGAPDPSETTLDGRRAALDKAVEDSRTPKAKAVDGFRYSISIKNESRSAVSVLYWEYRFTPVADPQNVIRRQFLCSANIKPGATKDLSLFSTLGPTDVIAVPTLAPAADKPFKEDVVVDRIEFEDGSILQRPDWKFADVKKAVERATSTPWTRDVVCRIL